MFHRTALTLALIAVTASQAELYQSGGVSSIARAKAGQTSLRRLSQFGGDDSECNPLQSGPNVNCNNDVIFKPEQTNPTYITTTHTTPTPSAGSGGSGSQSGSGGDVSGGDGSGSQSGSGGDGSGSQSQPEQTNTTTPIVTSSTTAQATYSLVTTPTPSVGNVSQSESVVIQNTIQAVASNAKPDQSPQASPGPENNESKPNIGSIIGGVVGGTFGLCLLIAALYGCRKKFSGQDLQGEEMAGRPFGSLVYGENFGLGEPRTSPNPFSNSFSSVACRFGATQK